VKEMEKGKNEAGELMEGFGHRFWKHDEFQNKKTTLKKKTHSSGVQRKSMIHYFWARD